MGAKIGLQHCMAENQNFCDSTLELLVIMEFHTLKNLLLETAFEFKLILNSETSQICVLQFAHGT